MSSYMKNNDREHLSDWLDSWGGILVLAIGGLIVLGLIVASFR